MLAKLELVYYGLQLTLPVLSHDMLNVNPLFFSILLLFLVQNRFYYQIEIACLSVF